MFSVVALKAIGEYESLIGTVGADYKTEEEIQSRKTALAMAYSLDKNVQRINRALKRNGLTDDTIIVFVSDNGGKPKSNFSSNKPLSGHKGEVDKLGNRYIYWVRVNKAAIRDDEFKLIKFRKKKYELYKLSEKPEEFTLDENEEILESYDVSAKYREKLEELKLKFAQWQEKHPVPTWGVEAPEPTIYKGEAETK